MVKTVPQLYRYIYDRAERAERVPAFRRWVSQYTAANLRALVNERRPDVVVCTHAFPCGVMSEYKRQFDPALPVVAIVTDFVVHPFWIYPNVDAYAVATSEMRATLLARGIAGERVLVSGIPVDARFARPRLGLAELRAELGLAGRSRQRADDGGRPGHRAARADDARAGTTRFPGGRHDHRRAATAVSNGACWRRRNTRRTRCASSVSSTTSTTTCTRATCCSPSRAG